MNATRKLGSPIEMSLPYRKICPGDAKVTQGPKAQAPNAQTPSGPFLKYGHPFRALGRFFIGLEPRWGGINAIEFTKDSPVAYLKKLSTGEGISVDRLSATCHPNLVNLKEAFIATGAVFFVYEKEGLSLEEILNLSAVFRLGEIEVAFLCHEILQGLQYIHQVLETSHGSLNLSNIHIMEDGAVKIANIGESMVLRPAEQEKSQDIQAVCRIARTLLGQNKIPEARGTVGILASDFTNVPPTATIDELLQHSFLRISTGPWCLRPVSVLCTVAQRWQHDHQQGFHKRRK
ncbi:hypothetical protein BDW69DRAFT_199916 [Aspergillus filifer]